MHRKQIITAGKKPGEAKKALIMLHGRGADAYDILGLAERLNVDGFALLSPQATNNSWYPLSFLAPPGKNEPWLTSALQLLYDLAEDIKNSGIEYRNIFFLGFSQGACLTLEFTTRNAKRWGGIVAFTGGLIGDRIYHDAYKGNFEKTPVFMGTSDPDFHVPVERVNISAELLRSMDAEVTVEIYKNMGHTVSQAEIDKANAIIFS